MGKEITPEQRRAGAAVHKAISSGRLVRQPCEVCGKTKKVHAHHDNYTKPLDVRWLCPSHHHEAHGKTARAKIIRKRVPVGYEPQRTVVFRF